MKPIRIYINEERSPLSLNQIKYIFKTILIIAGFPYHFIKEGYADIRYGRENKNCKLFIQSNLHKVLVAECLVVKKEDNVSICDDIIFITHYLLEGIEENSIKKDKHNRPKVKESFLYYNGCLREPIINNYINLIRDLFKSHNPIPIWEDNKKYCVVLTHDVDCPSLFFWKFKEWVRYEKSKNLKSAFYFCAKKGNPITYYIYSFNPFYDITNNKFKELFEYLKHKEFEIGLHASYNAHKSVTDFKNEKKKLESIANITVSGNRHHYWKTDIDFNKTAEMHNEIGLLYDTSLAFTKCVGFRRSICSPFFINNTLQLPTALMDDYLSKNYKEDIDYLLEIVKKFNGILVVDYHVRGWINKKWRTSYKYLINKIIENDDFYCDTPKNVAKYWIKRSKKIIGISNEISNSNK